MTHGRNQSRANRFGQRTEAVQVAVIKLVGVDGKIMLMISKAF